MPDDRELQAVYDREGRLLVGRKSISDGYLHEINMDMEYCKKALDPTP